MRVMLIVGMFLCGIFNFNTHCSSQNNPTEEAEYENVQRNEEGGDSEIFKPTYEWQKIKESQSIPRGLHVRLNLETGEREAKLLDDGERTDLTSVLGDVPDQGISQEQLQAALKHLPGEDSTATLEDIERVRKSFRSYDTLKKDFEALELTVKTDLELLNELLTRFKSGGDDQELLNILTDLEYMVHQFDNAQEFAQMGGLMDVVLPSVNASSVLIRSEAIRLLGSAAQSNTAVQISALESGCIDVLLRVLALDQDPTVRSRALYALSCLVRRFPTALIKMVADGGLDVLAILFQSEAQDDLKLQVKVVTLLHDLVLEVKETEEAWQGAPQGTPQHVELEEKQRQYRAAGLSRHLVKDGWCSLLPRLLHASPSTTQRAERRDDLSSAVTQGLPVRPEHDVIEKVVAAMLVLADICGDRFRDARNVLLDLERWYQELAAREELDKKNRNISDGHYYYYTGLAQQVASLAARLELHRDEL